MINEHGRPWASVDFSTPVGRARSFRFTGEHPWWADELGAFRQFAIGEANGALGTVSYKKGASLLRAQVRWEIHGIDGTVEASLRQTRTLGVPGEVVRTIRRRPLVEYVAFRGEDAIARVSQKFRSDAAIELNDPPADPRLLVTGLVLAFLLDG